MNHCPEPWTVTESETIGRYEIDHSGNGSVVGCDGLFKEDAYRIVACVNACEEITTKDLQNIADWRKVLKSPKGPTTS